MFKYHLFQKDIETYENTVKRKDAQIKSLNWRIENLQFINKELEEKNRKLQAELKLMKTAYNSNKKEYDHKLSNQKVEMHSLKEKCGLTAGKHDRTKQAQSIICVCFSAVVYFEFVFYF